MLAEDRQGSGYNGHEDTQEEGDLDGVRQGRRPGRFWESGNVVPEGGIVNLVDKNAEEGVGLITWVGLEFRVDLGDQSRDNCRK